MKNMANLSAILILMLFIGGGWIFFVNGQQNTAPGDNAGLIRLHILANSDSEEDQQVKLKVRDAVVAYLAPRLEGAATGEQARQVVIREREEMLRLVREAAKQSGADYPVALETGWFEFPLRSYGTLVLPAGKYEAVRILLGNAQGKNWWCVLFPPLCLVDATGTVAVPGALTAGDNRQKVEIRWKAAELLAGRQNRNDIQ